MQLPRAFEAVVPSAKITDYLLSRTNPRSQHKTAFFEAFGFSKSEWELLAAAIRAHAIRHAIADQEDTSFGTWYTVEGALETPRGIQPTVRTVWFVDTGAVIPRFVTAYPLPRNRP
jgi:hypothetical protein